MPTMRATPVDPGEAENSPPLTAARGEVGRLLHEDSVAGPQDERAHLLDDRLESVPEHFHEDRAVLHQRSASPIRFPQPSMWTR